MPIQLKSHKFKFQVGTSEPQVLSGAVNRSTNIQLSQLSTTQQSFVARFSKYKIVSYSYNYRPFFNTVGQTVVGTGVTAAQAPLIRFLFETNPDLDDSLEGSWDANPGVKFRNSWQKFSVFRKVRPSVQVSDNSGVLITIPNIKSPWISTADPTLSYGVMRTRLDGPDDAGLGYQVNEYMYVICKDLRVPNL